MTLLAALLTLLLPPPWRFRVALVIILLPFGIGLGG